MLDRRVLVNKVSGDNADINEGDTAPFSAFLNVRNIILLGDPGSGKTELLKSLKETHGGNYLRASIFIFDSPVTDEKDYYIDALDERRSSTNKNALTDQVTERLWKVRPEKVRLSSRKQDWLGDADLEIFRHYFDNNGGYIVVTLLPLTDAELVSVLISKNIESPEIFIRQAKEKKLDGLLQNPQNAIMLAQAVNGGTWPSTRRDVFDAATRSLLEEYNRDKSIFSNTDYTADELRDTAGELCALRLIADLPGYRLHSRGSNEHEGLFYREVRSDRQELIRAVLQRPAFRATDENDCLDCIHRTVAEFMAGQWLASRIDNDLSPARLDALVGREGHPVTALRGLCAWISVFSRNHSDHYLRADPLGALTNGDVFSLTPQSKRVLLQSLRDYSTVTPWFSIWGESAEGLKALGIPELQEEILGFFNESETSGNMRLALLHMITPLMVKNNSIRDMCRTVVETAELDYEQAEEALTVLFYDWNVNRQWFNQFLAHQTVTSSVLRLRVHALSLMSEADFNPAEMTTLLQEILEFKDSLPSAVLYDFHSSLSTAHALEIITSLAPRLPDKYSHWNNSREVGYLMNIKIYDIFMHDAFSDEEEIIVCLNVLEWFSDKSILFNSEQENLRNIISPYKDRIINLAVKDIKFNTEKISNVHIWANELFHKTKGIVDYKDIIEILINSIGSALVQEHFKVDIYIAAHNLCLRGGTSFIEKYNTLLDMADGNHTLSEIRNTLSYCKIDEDHIKNAEKKLAREIYKEEYVTKLNIKTEEAFDSNQSEDKKKIMQEASKIYWGGNRLVNTIDSPSGRLESLFSPPNIAALLKEWKLQLFTKDFPNYQEVESSAIKRFRHPDGLTLLTAAEVFFEEKHSLDELNENVIRVLLILELTEQVMFTVKNGMEKRSYRFPWLDWMKAHSAAFIGETLISFLAYVELENPSFHYKEMIVRRLLAQEYAVFWPQMLLILRHDFHNSINILRTSIRDLPDIKSLIPTVLEIRKDNPSLPEKVIDMWNAFDYLTCDVADGHSILENLAKQPDTVFMVRELAGLDSYGGKQNIIISPDKIEQLISALIALFPEKQKIVYDVVVTERSIALEGDRFISRLLSVLSADSSATASCCLFRLTATHHNSTYRDDIMQARQNQIQRRREVEYISPAWTEVRATLQDQKPANAADLHALLCDRIEAVAKEIRHGNTDNWKLFWNENSRGAVDDPKSENSGTDVMITLLKPHLQSLDVSLQPEMHMAQDKRADIGAMYAGRMKILIEVKRNYHTEVWTAAENQLQKLYTPDPDSDGYGIFLVFWFGGIYISRMPLHPVKGKRPGSAVEMAQWLSEDITDEARSRIKCFVIDISSSK